MRQSHFFGENAQRNALNNATIGIHTTYSGEIEGEILNFAPLRQFISSTANL